MKGRMTWGKELEFKCSTYVIEPNLPVKFKELRKICCEEVILGYVFELVLNHSLDKHLRTELVEVTIT